MAPLRHVERHATCLLPVCQAISSSSCCLQLAKERFHFVSGKEGSLDQFASGLSFHLAPGHTPGQVSSAGWMDAAAQG